LAENVYEGLFILDSNRYARDPGGVSGQIAAMLQKYDGKMLASRLWEERRLAYPIAGQRKGAYWLAYFRLDSAHVDAVRRDCQLNDSILRELILKVDSRIVDALVSHAQSTVADAGKPKPRPEPVPVAVAPDGLALDEDDATEE
jgi:small subunit ribosomal protein S6